MIGAAVGAAAWFLPDLVGGPLLSGLADRFGPGGFRYPMENGVVYDNAHYQHSTTFTAVGHATLFTGGNSPQHGLAGNDWYDANFTNPSDVDPEVYLRPDARAWFKVTSPHLIDRVTGYLAILDRKKDLIIRGGFNVYPRDIEDVLVQHPEVAMAGVVGKPDPRLGEEVVAFVQLSPKASVTEDELLEFAKEHLGKYKYPREVRIIEGIPLTPVLKIDRKQLRTLL